MRRTGLLLLLTIATAFTAGAQTQTPNTIATFAGGGTNTGAATNANLPRPIFAFRDNAGNTYISVPALGIIYKVTTGGTISAFAGNGTLGFSGDGGAATSAQLDYPQGMAFDSSGNLYIADTNNNRVRKVTPGGVISTVAGSGTEYNGAGYYGGYSGDGGQATDAMMDQPTDVAFDASGNMYIADSNNNVIRIVNGSGVIKTFAGTGTAGYLGDNGAAASAELNYPVSVTTDSSGNLYIADNNNCIVRKVDTSTSHIITTYAGTPQVCGFGGDGAAATSAQMRKINAVRMDSANNLLIADTKNYRIRKVDNTSAHDISTIVGNGLACTTPSGCGDGGSPTSAVLNYPIGVSADSSGNILVTDTGDARVRVVSSGSSPTITAFAGGGTGSEGGAATSAVLALPYVVKVDASGNVFIVDTFDLRVREIVHGTTTITTVAGNGVRGVPGSTNGDGGAATSASFIHPVDLAIDAAGDLFILDDQDEVIREVNAQTHVISTVAGNGAACGTVGNPNTFPTCGNGGPATSASLYFSEGIAVDSNNNIYVSDQGINTVRTFKVGGNISTFAGTPGQPCTAAAFATNQCGDNGPPTSALLNSPNGIEAVPSIEFLGATDVYIADAGDNVIRQVSGELGSITTVVFNREPTFGGDGGTALGSSMYFPGEIALDADQNLFVGAGFDNIVRRIDNSGFSFGLTSFGSVETVAGDVNNLDGGFSGDGGPSTKALLSNFGLAVDASNNLYIGDAGNNRIRIVPMAPVASWTPTTLPNFGTVLAGQAGNAQIVTFTNSGLNDLTLTQQGTPPVDFTTFSSCPAPPLESCDLIIEFAPPAGTPGGAVSETLTLATNDPNNPAVSFTLTGTVSTSSAALTALVVSPISGAGIVVSSPTGIDCPTTGCTANFATGTVVTLVAEVNPSDPGVAFVGWSSNCAPVTSVPWECTITMSAAATVTATFGAPSLTVGGTGNGTGVITSSPAGLNCTVTNGVASGTCTFTFPVGTGQVTLTATANSGSTFVGWSDFLCTNTTGTTCVLSTLQQLYTNEEAIAVFSVPRVGFTQGDVFVGATAGLIYEYHPNGTLVQILPSLNFNTFAGFGGGMMFDASGNLYAANPNFNSTAGGAGVETFASNGTGPAAFGGPASVSAGSVRIDSGPNPAVYLGLEANSLTGNLLKYNPGVTTAPSATYYPAYYSTSGVFAFEIAHDNATMYYTIGGTSIYSYNFVLGLQNPDLTDTLPGPYAGDLRQLPDGTLLLADGDRVVRVSTVTGAVTQTYQPTTFSLLLGLTLDPDGTDFWTDDSVSGIVYKINISSGSIVSSFNTNLAANQFFGLIGLGDIAVYGSPASGGNDLTVDLGGLGTGTVTSSPAGISCPPTCTANFGAGSVVTLTATPGAGSSFGGWTSNTACSGTGTCTITMSAAEAVTATFNTQQFTLTLTDAGTGSGTVTSSPAGINCTGTGPNCSANFNSGTQVTLTESPASGSTFAGWSGNAACSGTGTCTITMSAAESVTATFNTTTTFALTVTEAGSGGGTVSSAPSGILCPSTCTANFASGTQVTLTATANSGSTFAGWSGNAACSGTGTCTITMSAVESVTATFNTQQFALTVTKAGTGTGTVTSSPAGINCGSTCSANFNSGSQVTLTATPNSGSTFAGWSGNTACSGTGTCTITMSAAEGVTATFNTGAPLTINVDILNNGTSGVGTVTDSTGAINCTTTSGQGQTGTCSTTYPVNSTVTFTETPGAGSGFTGWSNYPCQSGGNPNQCTISVTTTGSLFASFANGPGVFTLTVALPSNLTNSTGGGNVTSGVTGGGISCTFNGTNPPTGACSNSAEKSGAVLELIPVASANSTFGGYAGTCPSQVGNNCYVTMSQNQTVTPVFTIQQVTLNVTIPTGNGSLLETDTGNSGKINCTNTNGTVTGTCSASYPAGTVVTLTETPATGYSFTSFTGCATSTATTCTLTLVAGNTASVSGGFTINTYLLDASTEGGSGTGTVTSNANNLGGTINCGPNNQPPSGCGLFEQYNWPVTLTAAPSTGSTFAGWSASGVAGFTLPCTTSTTCTFNMPVVPSGALTVTATFNTTTTFPLTVTEAGTGGGTVSSSPSGILCPSTCSANFTSGAQVTLTATSNSGSAFAGWSGNAACSGTGSCTITMSATESVTATFNTATTFPLTVTEAGTGGGTVSSSPSGILCPSTCSGNFTSGMQVTLTATANSGSAFAGWSGNAACTGTGTCTLTMSAAQSVTATFNTQQFSLTLSEQGAGSGTVTSSPAGINCPTTCSANFNSGTVVTLTETPASGSVFTGWGGACTNSTSTCTVTMSAAQSVTATFNTQQFALSVTEAGTGSGTVSSSPSGILCPSTCSANFTSGTQVTLTATANSGSTFAGWSGNAACTGTGTCTLTMSAAQSVTATFNKTTFTLTVIPAGTGSGTITSQPGLSPAINCTTGSTTGCTASYPSGTTVTLTEAPASGSTFASWSLDCGGSTCTFSMTQNQNVTVTFTASGFPLTVTEAGTGTGSVVSAPTGISCPSTCSANFNSGTQVTLTATAGSGSTFAGWSGACSGTGTCTVTMNSAQSVTATFNKNQFQLTVTLAGTGSGSVQSSPSGIDCPDGCSANFNAGSQVTLTETPGSGSNFAGWSGGGCTGTGTTCTVTMSAAESVTATFNNGANFTFTPSVGTSTSVNTTPGGNIVVGLVLSGTVKETVTLGCTSSAPQYLSCLITPTTVNLTGNGTTQVAIVLTSYCQGSLPGAPGDGPQTPLAPLGMLLAIGLTLMLIGMVWSEGNRRRWALTMACLLAIAVTGAACNNLPQGPNGVTPPGNYVLTVTATVAGQPAQAIQINVNVK